VEPELLEVAEPVTEMIAPVLEGQAGASAEREYERRRIKREADARKSLGGLGVVLTRVVREPQSTAAWKRGAQGEIKTAARLAKHLNETGVRILHDRRVPGHGHANIDHIMVGPGGITVADSKAVRGKVRVESKGGLFSSRRLLLVNGRDRTPLVEGVERQIGYIRAALETTDFEELDIRGALCFPNPDGLPLVSTLWLRKVMIDGPKRVAKLARRPGDLDQASVDRVWQHLDRSFPQA
jgi:hypothetical protein